MRAASSDSVKVKIDHPQKRAAERTRLTPQDVERLRRAVLNFISIPHGAHHLRIKDIDGGGFAVIKDVGNRHVLATFLARDMIPPGFELSPIIKTASLGLLLHRPMEAFRVAVSDPAVRHKLIMSARDTSADILDSVAMTGQPAAVFGPLFLNTIKFVNSVRREPAIAVAQKTLKKLPSAT